MAKTVVTNAILHVPASMDERHITWCTFTDPELAHVGRNETELKRDKVKYSVYRFPLTQLDRAITESETTGVVKVLASRWGQPYVDEGAEAYEKRYQQFRITALKAKARELGYELVQHA